MVPRKLACRTLCHPRVRASSTQLHIKLSQIPKHPRIADSPVLVLAVLLVALEGIRMVLWKRRVPELADQVAPAIYVGTQAFNNLTLFIYVESYW